ncbi:hypothetical protein BHE74_00000346 [Ensete ventricosum]|nr:hypothetical protein BHE74_00000346 [Ensete ventricosum]
MHGDEGKKSGEGGREESRGKGEVESCDWLKQPVLRWGPLSITRMPLGCSGVHKNKCSAVLADAKSKLSDMRHS